MKIRTHNCGALRNNHQNQKVILQGWISSIRRLSSILFFVIEDFYGETQIVCNKEQRNYSRFQDLSLYTVVELSGIVRIRKTPNLKMPTGQIEVALTELIILNVPKTQIAGHLFKNNYKNFADLYRYRYLYFRNYLLKQNLILKNELVKIIRYFLDKNSFIEIHTPILTKPAGSEGAKDFLVPVHLNSDQYYGLAQSPQLFKQILMYAFDKYYQICTCFRNENFRANRQMEFLQVDIELCFCSLKYIQKYCQNLFITIWQRLKNIKLLHSDFIEITYQTAVDIVGK